MPTIYINHCTGVTIGDKYTYYNGSIYNGHIYNNHDVHFTANDPLNDWSQKDQPEIVVKDDDIVLLMESTSKVKL